MSDDVVVDAVDVSRLFVRSRYSPRVRVTAPPPSGKGKGAKQSFKDECNINLIMRKFIKTGLITHVNTHSPMYGEVPSQTYHEAMEIVRSANEMFAEVPAAIRKKFGNSPEAFLDFVNDPKNVDELRKLGMVKPVPEKIPDPLDKLGDRIEAAVAARAQSST